MNPRLLSILSTSAAVALLVLYIQECARPKVNNAIEEENYALKERIITLNGRLAALDTSLLIVRNKKLLDSLSNLEAVKRLTMRETVLVQRLKAANADITVIMDSLPRVRRYVELADSTISVKDSLYAQAVSHSIALDSLYRIEISALGSKNVIQKQINTLLETKVSDLEAQKAKVEKKLERKRKGNRLLAGIAAGLGAAVAVMALTN